MHVTFNILFPPSCHTESNYSPTCATSRNSQRILSTEFLGNAYRQNYLYVSPVVVVVMKGV